MIPNLDFDQLLTLLRSVFALGMEETLTILVDLPGASLADHPAWCDRRAIAIEWYRLLQTNREQTPFRAIHLACYTNVGSNNNELPAVLRLVHTPGVDLSPADGEQISMRKLLSTTSVVLAPTELSATAPLKILAREFRFRGATLPGFTREMIRALGMDYEKVNERVLTFKRRLDQADAVIVRFIAAGDLSVCHFDLRHRTAHASGGLMREPGVVANLPSGEAYIVPYEGEIPGDPSRTEGILPVQFHDEIVRYKLLQNRALAVVTKGKFSERERDKLLHEPAYGNIAEVGFGVLGEWGVSAVGSTLLDEKLGLHIAFGRSDHFGGVTGPGAFHDPKNVVHQDWVYVPSVQPTIEIEDVVFEYSEGSPEIVMHNGKYLI
jgi:hypothetical protein